MTKAFRRFCSDYRTQILTGHIDRFIAGQEEPPLEAETRARAAQILEFLALDVASIHDFYKIPPQQTAAAPVYVDPLTLALPPGVLKAMKQGTSE